MQTKIIIKGLRLHGLHGVGEQEQIVGNEFSYDVEILYPFAGAAADDDLTLTVNYAEIVEIIKEENALTARLIETVAMRIRNHLCSRFPAISGGCVRVAKLTPPIPSTLLDYAAAEISW